MRVAVRIRPLRESDQADGAQEILRKVAGEPQMGYPSEEALQAAFRSLVAEMRTAEGSRGVGERMRPFFTPKFYYAYDEWGQGLEAYRDYLLGECAVGKGWDGAFADLQLVIGPCTLTVLEERVEQ